MSLSLAWNRLTRPCKEIWQICRDLVFLYSAAREKASPVNKGSEEGSTAADGGCSSLSKTITHSSAMIFSLKRSILCLKGERQSLSIAPAIFLDLSLINWTESRLKECEAAIWSKFLKSETHHKLFIDSFIAAYNPKGHSFQKYTNLHYSAAFSV